MKTIKGVYVLKSPADRREMLRNEGESRPHLLPDSYPCFAIMVLEDYGMERLQPAYLYPADLRLLLREIDD